MSIEKYISPFIQTHFPEFYKEYGSNFIAFTRAYYEWLESVGNPLEQSRSLYEYSDIDNTLDTFVKYFKNKYMLSIPESIVADKRLLSKHILDLYRSKGSLRSYELLFRILFNEDIQVYIPGNDLFRLSNNQYTRPIYIEISSNKYLSDIVGKIIYDSSLQSSAVVENYSTKIVNNETINILTLSAVTGSFRYGYKIICNDLYVNAFGNKISNFEYNQLTEIEKSDYNLAISIDNAPLIIGSLSSIGIINGGAGFSVGEFLNVNGDGTGGIARVSAVRDENGKVTFNLINGGSGFSINPAISVTGGGGAGATFKVGDLVDKEIFNITTDIIEYSNTTIMDNIAAGCNVAITGSTGTWNNGDTVRSTSSVNVVPMDINLLVDNSLANGENLSNSSLNITNLTVYRSDGTLIYVNGTDIDITNPNLVSGVTLISNTTSSIISINTILPVQNAYGNGTISSYLGGVLTITGADFGYFVPGSSITNVDTGATATVSSFTRNTNWPQFTKPTIANKNLDIQIGLALNSYDIEVGTIAYLSEINPGSGYSSDPIVTIQQPEIYDLKIQDGTGFKGYNATVTGDTGSAVGIAIAADIYDSGFAYSPDSYVTLSSSNTQNQTVVTGTTVVDKHGIGTGFFANRSGFLSDTQRVIDSQYWQTQSYDIIATKMLSSYEKFVRDLVHPAGIALYGSFRIVNEIQNEVAIPESFTIGSIGYDLASRWASTVVARGGSVSASRLALVSTLFENLLVNNTFYNIDDLWLLACENSIQATTSLKQLRTVTLISNPIFTIDRGFQMTSTGCLNTNFIPTVHAITLNTNNVHMSVYNRYNASSPRYDMGAQDGIDDNRQMYFRTNSSNTILAYLNTTGFTASLTPVGNTNLGLTSINRSNNNVEIFKNGTLLSIIPPTTYYTMAPVPYSLYIGGLNSADLITNTRNTANIAFASVGGSLTAAQHSTLCNSVQSYMVSVGASV
jgi:hypothetical protein